MILEIPATKHWLNLWKYVFVLAWNRREKNEIVSPFPLRWWKTPVFWKFTSIKLYVNFDNFGSFFFLRLTSERKGQRTVTFSLSLRSKASKEANGKRETMYYCVAFCEQLNNNIVTVIFDFVRFQLLSMTLVLAIVSPSKSIQFCIQSHFHSP